MCAWSWVGISEHQIVQIFKDFGPESFTDKSIQIKSYNLFLKPFPPLLGYIKRRRLIAPTKTVTSVLEELTKKTQAK